MIVRREPDAVWVPVTPREGLDRGLRVLGVDLRSQDRAVADTRPRRAGERRDDRAGILDAMGGITARKDAAAGGKRIVAQHDVLTRDVVLVGATAVVIADH